MGRIWFSCWMVIGFAAVGFTDRPAARSQTSSLGSVDPTTHDTATDQAIGQQDSASGASRLAYSGAELAEQLADPNYSVRRRATLRLWEDHGRYQDAVKAAIRHPDQEVATRAKWIAKQWRLGILPNTPRELSRQFSPADSPEAVRQLLRQGHYQLALIAIEETAGTDNEETLQTTLQQELDGNFPYYARQSVIDQTERDLLELVDRTANSPEMSLCRIQMMTVLEIPVDEDNLLPSVADGWTVRKRQQTTDCLLAYLGHWDQLLERADDRGDMVLKHRALLAADQTAAAMELSLAQAQQTQPGTIENARWWAETLHCAARIGHDPTHRLAIEALSAKGDSSEPVSSRRVRRNSLLAHGLLDEAFQVSANTFPVDDPMGDVRIWLTCDRPAKAFETLGFKRENLLANLHAKIDHAIAQQQETAQDLPVPAVRKLIAVMRVLIGTGDTDSAWQIASRLSTVPPATPEKNGGNLRRSRSTRRIRDAVIGELARLGLDDWVAKLAIVDGEKAFSATALQSVADTLPTMSGGSFAQLVETLGTMFPDWTLRQRLQNAIDITHGKVPVELDSAEKTQRLFELWTARKQRLTMAVRQQLLGRPTQRVRGRLNLDMVDTMFRLGRSDLAQAGLQKLVQLGNAEALVRVAQQANQQGDIGQARQVYQRLVEAVNPSAAMRHVVANSGIVPITSPKTMASAMIELWQLSKTSGDVNGQQSLRQQLNLMVCGPTKAFNLAVASELASRGEYEWAKNYLHSQMMVQWVRSDDESAIYDLAREFALIVGDREPALAARWFDNAISQQVFATHWLPLAYVILPVSSIRWELAGAIEQADLEKVDRAIEKWHRFRPLDINLPEEFLQPMREAGLNDSADRILQRVLDQGRKYVQEYPRDGTMANNLAWLAALNDTQLSWALSLARYAVSLEPDSSVFRDTLAEVLFRLDRRGQAMLMEQHCLLDTPDMWHLHEQIERFVDSDQ